MDNPGHYDEYPELTRAGESIAHALECEYIVSDNPWAPCTCGFGRPSVIELTERDVPYGDIAEFVELIDDYQCAQIDGTHDERAKARIALMDAYRTALASSDAQAPSVLTDWQHRCAALVDIYDDALNNAPEDRCYVDGAFTAEMDEIRALLAASMGGESK